MLDLTSKIIDYENGELDQSETIELFQHLVDSGLAWELQGHYGRTARQLLDNGWIHPPSTKDRKEGRDVQVQLLRH